jgi:hypothetical protein
MATRGILLCSWGRVCYGYAAFNLAASIKHLSPSVDITLMSDSLAIRDLSDHHRAIFNSIIPIDQPVEDPGLFKVSIYRHLPYDYTLFLDVDALALNPVEGLLDKLIKDFEDNPDKNFYRCHVHDWYDHTSPESMPMMYWAHRSVIWDKYGFDASHKLPGTQSSIQFIAKSERAERFYSELVATMRDNPIPLELLKNRWGGTQPDELYLNIQIAKNHLTPDIEKAMWFCDNANGRPTQLTADGYYFLSYFGIKERIKRYFMEWYDKEPVKFLRKLGYSNHIWKSHQIFDQKHAANKVKPIQRVIPVNNMAAQNKAAQERFTPLNKKITNLFTTYYKAKTPARQRELYICLQNNINNPAVDKIYVASECEVPLKDDKIQVLPMPRPTFRQMVDLINSVTGNNEINILVNSDIFTDQTISMVSDFNMKKTVLCLCRHDITQGAITRFIEAEYSQDTWIWQGKLEFTGGDYHFGILGCDNVFAYQVNQAGYQVLNPSRHIKTTHLHLTPERSYSEKTRLPRPYLHVPVSGIEELVKKRMLIIQPGKVGDIIRCLPIAKHYSDHGYLVHWECPVQYHSLFDYVDYCQPVVSPPGTYHKTIDISFGLNTHTDIHKQWLQKRKNLDSFLSFKYEIAGVQVSKSTDLVYTRNFEKEKALKSALGITEKTDYIVIHTASDYGQPIEVEEEERQVVEFKKTGDFSILDWRGVLEGAQEIHCIDSSLCNFCECLDLDAKLFYYKTDKVPLKADQTLLSDKWIRVNEKMVA